MEDMENEPQQPVKKFNSALSFTGELPYDVFFAERLPLIHAFSLALGHARLLYAAGGDAATSAKERMPVFRVAECGVYLGNSLIACGQLLKDAGIDGRIAALDTFVGLPPLSKTDRKFAPKDAAYLTRVLFADTSLSAVQQKVRDAGLDSLIEFHEGLFSETLPKLPESTYHFVNIDCDLYEPHMECLRYFYPRMERGGIIFFDDYHSKEYPMAQLAIDRFLEDKPETLFHLRMGKDGPNRTKAYVVKH